MSKAKNSTSNSTLSNLAIVQQRTADHNADVLQSQRELEYSFAVTIRYDTIG